MKHLFILNPKAGGDLTGKEGLRRSIREKAEAHDLTYEIYETTGVMDAAEKVRREAIRGEELRVYACGGDGTLSECAHGAAGFRNAAVTHYPCGTGNDFIKTFTGDTDLFRDLDALLEGEVLPLDIIDVNGRKCLDIASVGVDARIGIGAAKYKSLPLVGNKAAYGIALVENLLKGINRKLTIRAEDRTFEGSFALVCACNGSWYGGGYNPVRTAVPDDGMLDILVVKGVSLFRAASLIGAYGRGEFERFPQYITHVRGRHLTVEAEEEFLINVDGEGLRGKKAEMRLTPQGVRFVFPRGSAFLASRLGRR